MPTLFDKVYGCLAASRVASSMGAAVEGWHAERIAATYGFLDRLLPYTHYSHRGITWERMPGTTEDGIERQKLICQAIIEKQDRITVEDLARVAVERVDPEKMWYMSEPDDIKLVQFLKAGIHPADVGGLSAWNALNAMARASHPIGLINAGDIQGAIDDVREIGQLYNTANSRGILWAEVTVTAIAAATKPGATVDSVIGAVFDNCDKVDTRFFRPAGIRGELERALKATGDCADVRDMRRKFDSIYSGSGMVYAHSYANEIVTKAICVLRMTKGNTWEAMKAGVNMGRDTDCLTAVAAGISGALSGADSIPPEVIQQADHATSVNPHTNSKRTLRENSDGLYNAFKARLAKMKAYAGQMDGA
jgi:ADP-ribosylglycohydrolase